MACVWVVWGWFWGGFRLVLKKKTKTKTIGSTFVERGVRQKQFWSSFKKGAPFERSSLDWSFRRSSFPVVRREAAVALERLLYKGSFEMELHAAAILGKVAKTFFTRTFARTFLTTTFIIRTFFTRSFFARSSFYRTLLRSSFKRTFLRSSF